ncbi:hypothetical protein [Tsuneonella sp. SYSU-LHT278]|uniref:hypothetical protein n=1 Tax=Tsuneonella sediminis TaxID=3416089 RepID=UPI003F79C614
MLKFHAAMAAALAVLAAPAVAGPVGERETVANSPDNPSSEKVICRTIKVIGSRLKGERMCKTATEWARDRTEQRNAVEKGQNQRTLSGG